MRRNLIIALFLGVVTAALYGRVWQYGFANLDDPAYVMENKQVLGGLSLASLRWAFTHVILGNWHPLTTLSLMLDATLYGSWPGGFHITNVVLHVLNTVLLFILLERTTGAVWRSALVAALFAWHPLHVEPVVWISSRKDVLSTLFLLLTLLAYVRYAARGRWGSYFLVLVLFVLGLMAKPMLVTLPFLLLLLDYWPLGRLQLGQAMAAPSKTRPVPLRALVLEKLPMIVLSVAFSVVAFVAQGDAVTSLKKCPLSVRLANVPLSYVRYLKKMFWPDDLAIFYPHPLSIRFLLVLAALCFLALVTIWVVSNGKRQPYLLVGWLWYLGSLVPVIGIIQLGAQAIADRYTYVPLIGLFIIIAWVLSDIQSLQVARIATAAVVAILVACVSSASAQLGYWKDNISLFTRALAVTASNSLAHYNLALAFVATGQIDKSIEHFETALAMDPESADGHNNLANALLQERHVDEAIEHYRMAITQRPNFAIAHINLGTALAERGRVDDAIAEFKAALRLEPGQESARDGLEKAIQLKNRSR